MKKLYVIAFFIGGFCVSLIPFGVYEKLFTHYIYYDAEYKNVKKVVYIKHGCFGGCPVDITTITDNLVVQYFGKKFVKNIGSYSSKVDLKTWKSLESIINQIQFINMDDKYKSKVEGILAFGITLDLVVTDTFSYTIEVYYENGAVKSVYNYHHNAPYHLLQLEFFLNQIISTRIFIKN